MSVSCCALRTFFGMNWVKILGRVRWCDRSAGRHPPEREAGFADLVGQLSFHCPQVPRFWEAPAVIPMSPGAMMSLKERSATAQVRREGSTRAWIIPPTGTALGILVTGKIRSRHGKSVCEIMRPASGGQLRFSGDRCKQQIPGGAGGWAHLQFPVGLKSEVLTMPHCRTQ